MECNICSRNDVAQVGMHCIVCARTAIYGLRLEAARLLLEKETLNAKIEKITSDTVSSNTSDDIKALSHGWRSELRKTNALAIKERIEEQKIHITSCKQQVSKLREELDQRRARVAQRNKDLEIIVENAPSRQHILTDKLKDIGKKGLRSFDSINSTSIETRAFLCREAANLLGMKHQRVKKAGQVRERFVIARHVISDLRSISSMLCYTREQFVVC
jgi:Vacuolar sorting 38 and autophagy-related subunit 14